jgi:hypothetical protein
VPQGPIKLAGLLDEVAEQPDRSRVSLNLLQDATPPPKKPFWKRYLPMIVTGCLAVVGVGELIVFVSGHNNTTSAQQQVVKDEQRSPTAAENSAFSKPVQELTDYLNCLNKGSCSFSDELSGEAAAKQFGYTRLFASAYEEVSLRLKSRDPGETSLYASSVAAFESIVAEEQVIDRLMAKQEQHAAAIAYLRALQNGDVVFPGPQPAAPAPPVLLAQLMAAYPGTAFDIDDIVFALVYREVREFAAQRLNQSGEVSVYEIIGEFRRLIAQSASAKAGAGPTQCEQGTALGYAEGLIKACAHLRFTPAAKKASAARANERTVDHCKSTALLNLSAQLESMHEDEVAALCERMEQRTRQGELGFLEIVQ